MDAEHRHELKTNELADWVAHFPDWCRTNAKTIIGVVLIVAAGLVYVYGKRMRSESRLQQQAEALSLIEQYSVSKLRALDDGQQNMRTSDALVIAANRLEAAVDGAPSAQVSALLLIKQGEALRADLHYRPAEVDVELIENHIKEARRAYEQALPLAEGNPVLAAMARFGLGLCAEEVGDYIKAEEIYNGIITNPDFAATVFPVQAQGRLDNMPDNRMQFNFVAAPPPKLEPVVATPPAMITPVAPGGADTVTVGTEGAPPTPAEAKEGAPAAENAPPAPPAETKADAMEDAPPSSADRPDESPDMNP